MWQPEFYRSRHGLSGLCTLLKMLEMNRVALAPMPPPPLEADGLEDLAVY